MTDPHRSSSTGTATDRPAHPYPGPSVPVTARNGMGTAALVLGILSVVFVLAGGQTSILTGWEPVVLGVLAIIFGSIGIGRVRRGEATNRSSALAGLLLGVVGLAVFLISSVFWVENGSGSGGSSTGSSSSSG